MPGVWGVSARSAVAEQWALGFEVVARMGRGLGGTGGSHLTDFRTSPRVISGVEYHKKLTVVSKRGQCQTVRLPVSVLTESLYMHMHWRAL